MLKITDAKDYTTKTFVDIGNEAIKELEHYNCCVRAFITDGLPAQKAAYDCKNKECIQKTNNGKYSNIFFVYCRCHLINCVIDDLVNSSHLMKKAQSQVQKITLKKKYRKKLGKLCPQPIDIRFCYDFKIIDSVVKNIQKLDDLHVPFYLFCYGIILEVLWDLYTEMEKFNATISTTHFALLLTINELKRIANMSACVCLHNTCYRAIELIDNAFEDEKDLARKAFSLSIIGRKNYQELAFNDDRELALFNSYEAKHQRIRNYFVFAISPVLFPPLEDQAIIRPLLKEEKNNSDYEEDEEDALAKIHIPKMKLVI